ncbi:MAG: hypothetical protein C0467_24645 [Planctomycetaceae bacterium]|nr:hypothetical protein [Planctomycetaceae bacterium]
MTERKTSSRRMGSSDRVIANPFSPRPRRKKPPAKLPVLPMSSTTDVADGLTPSVVEDLTNGTKYKQHPFGKAWQRFDHESFTELVRDVGSRGLDHPILIFQGMILDGWHRYLACLHTKTKPTLVKFMGSALEAAEKVHASGIRRHSTKDQKYASFDMLCDECAAFKAKYEQMKEAGGKQRQSGKPLSTGGQRVDVLKAKADAAGVGRSTAAKVEMVKKLKPKAVAQIAAGTTTANKELRKLKGDNGVAKTPAPKVKMTEGGTGVASTPAANTPGAEDAAGPLLTELVQIGSKLTDLLKSLDHVKWATEDQSKWDEAVRTISQAAARLSDNVQAGFTGVEQTEMRAVWRADAERK